MSEGLPPLPLPEGNVSKYVTHPSTPLRYHTLQSGSPSSPLILLLHGFPELALSWRLVAPELASHGYHVVAPDLRGYGRTTGWDNRDWPEVDLRTFSVTTIVRDMVILAHALGHRSVHCVVGHDVGAAVAGWCALARPDFFRRAVLMSHPFNGAPRLPVGEAVPEGPHPFVRIQEELDRLDPPRKHYKWYFSQEGTNEELSRPVGGLHDFLKGYFYLKSALWPGNDPKPLKEWSGEEFAKMPYYYIMPREAGMRMAVQTSLEYGPSSGSVPELPFLGDEVLRAYAGEYARTGFQGALNYYRVQTDPGSLGDALLFSGKKVEVPLMMVLGDKDWGNYQEPGVLEKMDKDVVAAGRWRGVRMLKNVGHWVPIEGAEAVVGAIADMCGENATGTITNQA